MMRAASVATGAQILLVFLRPGSNDGIGAERNTLSRPARFPRR